MTTAQIQPLRTSHKGNPLEWALWGLLSRFSSTPEAWKAWGSVDALIRPNQWTSQTMIEVHKAILELSEVEHDVRWLKALARAIKRRSARGIDARDVLAEVDTWHAAGVPPETVPIVLDHYSRARAESELATEVAKAQASIARGADPVEAIVSLDFQRQQKTKALRKLSRAPYSTASSAQLRILARVGDAQTGKKPPLLPSFLPELTRAIGGYCVGITTLAGRPGHGKTTLAEQEAVYQASCDRAVVFGSLEMSEDELYTRMALRMAGLTPQQANTRRGLSAGDMGAFQTALIELAAMPLYVVDQTTGPKTWPVVRAAADRTLDALRLDGLIPRLVIFDHLAKFAIDPKERAVVSFSQITKSIEVWSKECDVATLLLAQLNRGLEKDQGKAGSDGIRKSGRNPRASDIREAGSLEEDAYTVFFVWLPSRFDPSSAEIERWVDGHGRSQAFEVAQIIVTKARHGKPAKIPIWWDESRAGYGPQRGFDKTRARRVNL